MDADSAPPHLVPTELFGALALPADPTHRPPDALILNRVRELMSRATASAIVRAYRTPLHQAVLCGLQREQSTAPARQALVLLFEVLPRFLAAFDSRTPAGARDEALLLIGFGAALRRKRAGRSDAAIETVAQGLVIRVRRSKTDQAGRGDLIAIHRSSDPDLCLVHALKAWMPFRTGAPGPLFTRIRKGGQVTQARLSDQTVALIVKRGAETLGFGGFSGHSLRAGLATSAALAGADLAAITEQTRHRSTDIGRRYIRNVEIWRNNVTERLFQAKNG